MSYSKRAILICLSVNPLKWVSCDRSRGLESAAFAAAYFRDHPDIDVLYGACGAINETGMLTDEYPPRPWDLKFALENCDHIINQTASFMRREIIEKVDYLYPAWCHDHDLWLRIGKRFPVRHVDSVWAIQRLHDDAKTMRPGHCDRRNASNSRNVAAKLVS